MVQQGSGQTKLDFQRCAAMVQSKDDFTQQHYSEAAAPFGFISAVWRNGGSRDFVSRSLLSPWKKLEWLFYYFHSTLFFKNSWKYGVNLEL